MLLPLNRSHLFLHTHRAGAIDFVSNFSFRSLHSVLKLFLCASANRVIVKRKPVNMGPGGPGGPGPGGGPGGPGPGGGPGRQGWGPGPGGPGWGPGPGGPGWGPGPGGPGWGPGGPGFFGPCGFFGGCADAICGLLSSCFYCLCCCCLFRDCFFGRHGPGQGMPPPPF